VSRGGWPSTLKGVATSFTAATTRSRGNSKQKDYSLCFQGS